MGSAEYLGWTLLFLALVQAAVIAVAYTRPPPPWDDPWAGTIPLPRRDLRRRAKARVGAALAAVLVYRTVRFVGG